MTGYDHKYYCPYCKRYIFGGAAQELATYLNYHNMTLHPGDFANWTPANIVLSAHYSGPPMIAAVGMLPPKPRDPLWGDAQKPPDITERDKIYLAKGLVKW